MSSILPCSCQLKMKIQYLKPSHIQAVATVILVQLNNRIVILHVPCINYMRTKSQTLLPKAAYLDQISKDSLPGIINKMKPKHLNVRMKRRVVSMQKIQIDLPVSEKIRKEKERYMKPLTDVELIMKKFDEVSQSNQSITETPRPKHQLQSKFQSDTDKRIKQLLTLPSLKNIKHKIQKEAKQKVEPQTATLNAMLSEGVRLTILNKYDEYIKKAVKPTYRRLKTDYS